MNGWIVLFVVVGSLVPIVVAGLIVFFAAPRTPGSGKMALALLIGLTAGAVGGAAVSAVVIGVVLLIKGLR
jgi:hypothetical protein